MKKVLYLFLISIIGSLIVNSCSESTSPTVTKEYFPGKTGDYWIYEKKSVENKQEKTETDSTVISGSETVKGKTAMKYNSYIGGQLFESYFRYSDDAKLYALPSEMFPSDIKLLLPSAVLPDEWVVIADANAASWTMFTFNVENIPLPFGGTTVMLNGVVTITGNKGGTMSFDVSGKNYSTQEFVTKIAFNGTIKYNSLDIPFSFFVDSKSYFADKVGLIKTETAKQPITFQTLPVYTIEASSRMLTRFSVK